MRIRLLRSFLIIGVAGLLVTSAESVSAQTDATLSHSMSSLPNGPTCRTAKNNTCECDVALSVSACPGGVGAAVGNTSLSTGAGPILPTDFVGARTGYSTTGTAGPTSQASVAIDANGTCRYVDYTGPNPLFIPFRNSTQDEWADFITYARSNNKGLLLTSCTRPLPSYSLSAYADAGCANSPVATTTPNFYQRFPGPNYPASNGFYTTTFTGCRNGTTTIAAIYYWQPLNADTNPTTAWKIMPTLGPDTYLQATSAVIASNPVGTTLNLLQGDTLTLTWPASQANACVGSSSDQSWSSTWAGGAAGVASVVPKGSPSVTYTLVCYADAAQTVATVSTATINIIQPVTVTTTLTHNTIYTGGTPSSSTLNWTISDPSSAALSCVESASPSDPMNWSSTLTQSGNTTYSGSSPSLSPSLSTTYSLACTFTALNGETCSGCTSTSKLVVDEPPEGICGSANNSIVTAAPTTNLCGSNSTLDTKTGVTGTGPWTWYCLSTEANGVDSPQCSASAATYAWYQSGFGSGCPTACGNAASTLTQTVYCKSSTGAQVNNTLCAGPEPSTSLSCNATQACPTSGGGNGSGSCVAGQVWDGQTCAQIVGSCFVDTISLDNYAPNHCLSAGPTLSNEISYAISGPANIADTSIWQITWVPLSPSAFDKPGPNAHVICNYDSDTDSAGGDFIHGPRCLLGNGATAHYCGTMEQVDQAEAVGLGTAPGTYVLEAIVRNLVTGAQTSVVITADKETSVYCPGQGNGQ